MVEVVAWAASNGDRSETRTISTASGGCGRSMGGFAFSRSASKPPEVVDPEAPRAGQAATRALFGATVRYANAAGVSRVVSIVGTDEIDLNHTSWVSPLGRALMKSPAGDRVNCRAEQNA
jgi:transcription elongation factor GreB